MVKQAREYWKANFKQGYVSAWEWMGIRGILLGIIISLIVAFLSITTNGDIMQAIINAVITLLVVFFGYVILGLIFTCFDVPYQTIKKQYEMIADLQSFADRKEIINRIIKLRKKGVEIRNMGDKLMSPESITTWWQNHLDWREDTIRAIAMLDQNRANQWATLDTFNPSRGFPQALNNDHKHKLQMFDEWLTRLIDVIKELRV